MPVFSTNERFSAPSEETEQRINKIIAGLSLEEKIDLLGGHPARGSTQGNERAGIPEIKMADGPLGVHWWCDKSTAYPATICAAATWDRKLVNRLGWGLGRDARARGVHILLAPGVNIYRSPLCGRNFEYMGEDPFLTSTMVVEHVRGVQSRGVSATVKHYTANYMEFGRHDVSSDVDERTLHEVYLPAFRAAVREAGCGALMTGYNLVNGIHCSEHEELINGILKNRWGFDGLVMSDWVSTYSAVEAANAGLDIEMPHAVWLTREKLAPAVEDGLVSVAVIDDKVRRLLRLAACFGWLDNEQKDDSIPLDDPETSRVALDVARNGFVLLKNDNGTLPFDKSRIKTLAVVGPHALDTQIGAGGSSYTRPNHVVSLLEGIKAAAGDHVEVLHARGVDHDRCQRAYNDSRYLTPDGKEGLRVEYFANPDFSGKPVLVRVDPRIAIYWKTAPPPEMLEIQDYSIRWSGKIVPEVSGHHIFYLAGARESAKVFLDDTLLQPQDSDPWREYAGEFAFAKLQAGREHALRIELVKSGPHAPIFFGYEHSANIDHDREEALSIAQRADAVVLCTGFTRTTEGEGHDRSFALPKITRDFLEDILGANGNSVVAMTAGGGVDMEGWIGRAGALLHIWYPGQEGGTALGEILFGTVNPSGRLPATFERRLEDRSSSTCYHDHDGDQRVEFSDTIFGGYRHFDRVDTEPLFPFGFGLSYTSFEYSDMRLSASSMTEDETVTVSVDVTNTGERDGAEVVQLYVRDVEASLPRPEKELKGFEKVFLKRGETGTVEIPVDRTALHYYDPGMHEWVCEKGTFELIVARNARDIVSRAELTLC